jgi:phosphoserine phosphatase
MGSVDPPVRAAEASVSGLTPEVRALLRPWLTGARRGAAAFDADGTLWRGDVGEDLLRALEAGDHLPKHRGRRDVYSEYERRVARDPADAFGFAVEAMEGMDEAALEAFCAQLLGPQMAVRTFAFARDLIGALMHLDNEVWVVSASPVWAVWPGTDLLGVPRARVIGTTARVTAGRLTAEVSQPVPTLSGKAERLAAAGVRPELTVGNSLLDLGLLGAGTQSFVVLSQGDTGELARMARSRGWPIQWA